MIFLSLIILGVIFKVHNKFCNSYNTHPQKIKSILVQIYILQIFIGPFSPFNDYGLCVLLLFGWTLLLIDSQHYRIPNKIIGYLIFTLLIVQLVEDQFIDAILSGALFLLSYGLISLLSQQGLGFGDVKLASAIGLAIGKASFSQLLDHLFFASFFGLLLLLANARRPLRGQKVAFAGPLLAAALMVWPKLHMIG